MTVECPSQQLLRRYAIGDLDNDASDDVERHLRCAPPARTRWPNAIRPKTA